MACFALMLSATAARCQTYGGIFAQDGIMEHGGIVIDSFDSSDPNHCIWQTNAVFRANYFSPGINYGIWSNTLSYVSNSFPSRTADVTVFAYSNVVDLLGSTKIAGYLATGPGGTLALSGSASIGDLAWVFTPSGGGNQIGIEPGHWIQNANINFPSYPLPVPRNSWQNTWTNIPALGLGSQIKIGGVWTNSAGVWSYVGGTRITNTTGAGFNIDGINYQYVITNRLQNTNWVYYSINQLSHGQSLFIDAQYVVLYLTNGISYQNYDTLTVNTNADVQIWTTGNISATALSVINNMTGYAHAFSVYDVAGYPISVSLGGKAAATGYYYLPSSTLSFNGGGDFVGAIVCSNLNDNGGMNIHFDDSLGGLLPPWIIQQPTNQIVPLGSNATFSVSAGGSSLGYQWFFSQGKVSNSIPGAVDSSLTLTNVQLTDAGDYSVVVTNLTGSAVSPRVSLVVYTNAAATLSGAFNPTNGGFQFYVSGVTGLDYTLEASTNLVDWVPLWTNASPFSYTETNTEAYPQRFYRSIFIP